MANVTYLLGAGASCKCLPTYANFGSRLMQFKDSIEAAAADLDFDDGETLKEVVSLCKRLISEFSFHNTPDTVAKKYFHLRDGGKENLDNLKRVLVLYFMYEQCVSDRFIENTPTLKSDKKAQLDKRYDSFIAAILEPTYAQLKLRPNFNILTWNYDLQFELCFKNYYNQTFADTQNKLQCIPSYSSLHPEFRFDQSRFSIVHLNGIAYNKLSDGGDTPFDRYYTPRKELVKELVHHYREMKDSQAALTGSGLLNFAWERDASFPHPKHALDQVRQASKMVAEKTEVLVIIGYSFPIFNRDVDALILSEMKNLNKIYIQSPIAGDLKETIVDAFQPVNSRISHGDIVPVTSLDYFHIPHEANRDIPEPWIAF